MRISAFLLTLCLAACSASDPATGTTAHAAAAGDAVQAAAPADKDGDFRLSVFKWDGPLDASGIVRLRNPYGDIRVRASGEDHLYVSAQIQTFTTWQAPPVVEVVEVDGVTEVRVRHEHPVRASYRGDYAAGLAGRVDVSMLLPDGATLDATTTDGAVRVKGFDGSVRARTVSGEMYYKSSGPLDLATDSGPVEAVVRSYDAGQEMKIFTVSGPVRLRMTPEVAATVAITTAGAVDTAIEDGVKFDQRRLKDGYEMVIGGQGGRQMRIGSRTGAVQVEVDRSFSVDIAEQ